MWLPLGDRALIVEELPLEKVAPLLRFLRKKGVEIIPIDETRDHLVKKYDLDFFCQLSMANKSRGFPWTVNFINYFAEDLGWYFLSRNPEIPWTLEFIEGFKDKIANKLYNGIREKIDAASLVTIMSASNMFGRGFSEKRLELIMESYPNVLLSKEIL